MYMEAGIFGHGGLDYSVHHQRIPLTMISTLPAMPDLRRFLFALIFCLPFFLRAAPSINEQPVNAIASVGDPATFSVTASGANLDYQWAKNGIEIDGATNYAFQITAVADGDAAAYTVVITNSTGSITSRVALLTVVEPDIVATQPLNAPVNTCTNITLYVVTIGTDTNLSYQWSFDNATPVGGNSSNLVISGVQFANAGFYKVDVIDGDSSDAASGTLSVTDPPPVVITQNITLDLDATGNATITPAQVDNGSYDNCSIANMSVSQSSFNCANVGPNTVTLYVTDNNNQTSQAPAIVTVQDFVPPTAAFNSISVQLDSTGNYTLTPADIAQITAGSFDACGIASTNVTPSSLVYCDVGSKTVTLQLTDIHGNVTTTNSTINVVAPGGSPSVVFVDASYSGSCGAVAFPNNGGSGPYFIGYNAFSSIQAAVNHVASGGTVNVAAGIYNESVTASEPVTLLGANQGIAGCGTRGPESIISAGAGNAITVGATNVVVDGFELNGGVSVYDAGFAGSVVQNNTMTAGAAGVELIGITTTAGSGCTLQNNCITLTSQLAGSSPTVGVGINTVSGPQAPTIASNNVTGAFYGYLLYGLNAAVPTVVQGGSVTGVMQGVSVLNINPATLTDFSSSAFGINGVTISGFSGSYPALASAGDDFHAGVYAFTGGSLTSATLIGVVTNVTVIGSSNISPDSSGLYFSDFSTGSGLRQQITVQNCNVSSNENRGVFVSGSNAVATLNESTISGNGFNPYGTGGNFGFGIIARNNAQVTVSNCFISNPAAVTASYTVRALEADANTTPLGPTLVVTGCSIVNNGNPSGYLAGQDAGTLNASGNWWGTTSDTNITNLMLGVVDFTPYLDSGTDTDPLTPGFQGDFSALHVSALGAQTGSGGRIQEGISAIADGSLTDGNRRLNVEAGTYTEKLDYRGIWVNKPLTLSSSGGAVATTIDNTAQYMVMIDASNVLMSGFTVTDPTYDNGGGLQFGGDGTGIYIDWTAAYEDVHISNCVIHDLGSRIAGIQCGSGPGAEVDHCTIYNINGYPNVPGGANDYSEETFGIWLWEDELDHASIHDNNVSGIYPRQISAGINVSYDVANATVSNNQITVDPACTAGVRLSSSLDAGPQSIANNTITGGQSGILLLSPYAQVVTSNSVSGAGSSINVQESTATIVGNSASVGSQVGIWVSGASAKALIEGNTLVGDSEAGIKVDSGATVDAGDCTGGDVTGLGTGSGLGGSSAGGNVLTGYGFDGATPWAIENLNAGSPIVLAYQNNYGAVVGNNLATLFSGDVAADQAGGLLVQYPGTVTVPCLSNLPAGATSLADFVTQGGTVSATTAAVSYVDSVLSSNYPNQQVISRSYTVSDTCGETASGSQTIIVADTTPPTVTAWPTNQTLDVGGQCTVPVPDLTSEVVQAMDNCGVVTITQNPVANTLISLGTNNVTVTVTDQGGNSISTNVVLTVIDTQPAPAATYVDAAYVGLPVGTNVTWPANGGSGTHYIGCDAFPTVQAGINRVASNGTVNVAAGTYTEEVTINQSLSLLGPNATNNPNTGTRVAEAVIQPDTNNPDIFSNPNIYGNGGITVVYIGSANGVTIKGFTVDGYNPALTGAFSSGTDNFNAAIGIGGEAGSSSVRIENNIVKNDAYAGIDLESDGAGNPPTTNNFVRCNLIENIDYNAEGFGIGIILYNNYYADLAENSLTNVCIGISPQNFYQPNAGEQRNQSIASNKVTASLLGIWLNLVYNEATPNSTFAISNNTVSFMPTNGSVLFGPAEWDAIEISSIQVAVDVTMINNTITGPGADVGYNAVGYNVWNTPTTGEVTISGGSVSNVDFGVWVNDYDGYQSAGGSTKATVTNLTINGASAAGVYVQDDPRASTNGVIVSAVVTGNTAINNSLMGVLVQGTNASASVINNTASITGNSVGISVDTGKAFVQDNDLSGNTIAGISVTNGAIVDAGNCTGINVTGLGISSGGNNLSGSGFAGAAPWAIINGNPGGSPIVLADHDNFGAVLGNNISGAFSGAVEYSQSPAVIGAPTSVTVVCVSDVTNELAAATNLSSYVALGGYYSGSSGTVSYSDNPPYPYFSGSGNIQRTYTITDGCGLMSTAIQTITVSDTIPPVFTIVPTNMVVPVDHGQSYASDVTWVAAASDNCSLLSVVSNPTNGSTFPVGTTTVTIVATDTSSNYAVTNFTVEVVGPPEITQQPLSRTNNAGSIASFSVVATSPTPLGYLWKKNGVALSDGGNISGSMTSTLTIGSVSNSDVASYSVCVSNIAGAVLSSNATLTVIDPPVIVTQPMSITNNATTTATFAVTVSGTEPFGYQWYKDGTNQLADGGNISGSLTNILTLSNVLAADRGEYSVVVTNPAGVVVSSNATLSVVDPWIATQPVSATQPLGGTATFSVTALGTAPLTYLWQQNGVGIPGATNSSYTIGVIRDSDAGPYNVIVTSVGGSVTSSNATLAVTHPPMFVTQPQSQTVIQGQTASFNVTMNGTTPFTYQWQFGSANIPGATSHSLTLTDVTTAQAGSYDVLVTNTDGFAISTQAVLTVIVPPSFATQPTSITNNAGTTATFSVTADGTALTYQWFKNGTNSLSDGTNVSGSATATLTLSNVLGGDAGTYSVTISNPAGPLTSSNATLTVIDPVITNEPSSMSVILGQPASFSVGAVGTSPAYQWRMGGTPIADATNNSYSIASAADADAGSYDVIVTTIYGSVTSSPPAVLTVFDPAVVVHDPVSITRNAGTTATFTVLAGGTAPLSYQWLKNSSPLTDGGRIAGSLTSTLTISAVNDSDVAGYSVVVMNPYGTNTSASATLTVIDPPVITNEPVSITNNAGTTATFTVGVSGTEPLSYQWYKNGTNQLADGGNILGATSNILTLSNVFGIDRGDYSVVVTNLAGTATSSDATLTVIDPVITLQPTNITAIDGSTISFSVTAVGTQPLDYQWRQDDVDLADGFGISGSGTATLTITDVADSDQGSYSVVITNSEGVATSVEAVLKTIPPLIVFQPTNAYVLVGQPFSFSVSVNGTQPFSYQWVLNNTNINNATNRIYSVSSASFSDAGTYYVVVTNPDGTETSANAVLQVYATPEPTVTVLGRTNGNPALELQGVPTFTYQLQASSDLSTTNWVPVETNAAPFIFIDTNHFPQRFYRGVYAP